MTLLIDKRNLNSLERSSNSFIMTLEKFCHIKEICLLLRTTVQCAMLTIYTFITCVVLVYLFLCAILNTKDKAIDSTRKWQKVRKYIICNYSKQKARFCRCSQIINSEDGSIVRTVSRIIGPTARRKRRAFKMYQWIVFLQVAYRMVGDGLRVS